MKGILCLVTVIWFNQSLAKQIFDNSTLQKFICSRCKNSADEALSTDIKSRLKSFDEYFENLEDNKEIFCSDTKDKLVPMMKQVTGDMKPCFVMSNETFLPNFIFEGFAEFMEFLCGNRTIEIFYSDQGQDCVRALLDYQDGEEVRNCSCQLFKVFNNEILTYEDLCFELRSAEVCFGEAISHACPHFAAFRLLNSQFFRAVGELCNTAVVFYLNGSLIMMTVFLVLQNFISIQS